MGDRAARGWHPFFLAHTSVISYFVASVAQNVFGDWARF